MTWVAYREDDEHGYACVYLVKMGYPATREAFETFAGDIRNEDEERWERSFEAANAECERRNKDA